MVFLLLVIIIINFKIFSSISSDEIPPRSTCNAHKDPRAMLTKFISSVAIHIKYVVLVLLLCLLKYLGL